MSAYLASNTLSALISILLSMYFFLQVRNSKIAAIPPTKCTPNKVWKNNSIQSPKDTKKYNDKNKNNNYNNYNNNNNKWEKKKEEKHVSYGLTAEEEGLFDGLDEDDLIEFAGNLFNYSLENLE